MDINFLVIEGNIGSGKTSLSSRISQDFQAKLILEKFADNPFLPKFYQNPERYSFPLELSFLAERYNQLKRELSDRDLFHQLTVADYFFMKSLIFAQNTLAEDEYQLYRKFFEIIYDKHPKPDLYVYLHLPENRLIENIRKRGREYEQEIDEKYLKKISDGYFRFFRQQNDFPIVIIDTRNIDFVKSQADYEKLIHFIFHKSYNLGVNRVIL